MRLPPPALFLTWKKKEKRWQIEPDAAPIAPSTFCDVEKKRKNEGKSSLVRLPLPPALLLTATHQKNGTKNFECPPPLHQLHSWPGDVAADAAVDADADARVVTCLPRYPRPPVCPAIRDLFARLLLAPRPETSFARYPRRPCPATRDLLRPLPELVKNCCCCCCPVRFRPMRCGTSLSQRIDKTVHMEPSSTETFKVLI